MKIIESMQDVRDMVAAMDGADPRATALNWCIAEIGRLEKVIDRAGSLAMRDTPPEIALVVSGLDSRVYKLLHRIKSQQETIESQDRLIAEFTEMARRWGADV